MKGMNRGFTIIELLMVVAIIGIVAAIAISVLSDSRGKGVNAGIKSNMRTITQQAELFYLNNANTYGSAFSLANCAQTAGTLFADPTIWKALQETERRAGVTPTCVSTVAAWAVAEPLKAPEGTATYWCIDSQGNAKGISQNITTTSC